MRMNDILTVMRKEILEISHMRESRRAFLLALFVPALILGVSFPVRLGTVWVDTPISLLTWVLGPFVLITGIIADSVAGERERHTLETLLASRLSTSAILLGKIFAAMVYALVITAAFILLGIVSVNLVHSDGRLLIPAFSYLAGGLLLGILMASTAANLGVLVSVRAKTVRQAQQTMGFGIMILFFLPSILVPLLPEPFLKQIGAILDSINPLLAISFGMVALILLDIIFFLLAIKRFRRSKLLEG